MYSAKYFILSVKVIEWHSENQRDSENISPTEPSWKKITSTLTVGNVVFSWFEYWLHKYVSFVKIYQAVQLGSVHFCILYVNNFLKTFLMQKHLSLADPSQSWIKIKEKTAKVMIPKIFKSSFIHFEPQTQKSRLISGRLCNSEIKFPLMCKFYVSVPSQS